MAKFLFCLLFLSVSINIHSQEEWEYENEGINIVCRGNTTMPIPSGKDIIRKAIEGKLAKTRALREEAARKEAQAASGANTTMPRPDKRTILAQAAANVEARSKALREEAARREAQAEAEKKAKAQAERQAKGYGTGEIAFKNGQSRWDAAIGAIGGNFLKNFIFFLSISVVYGLFKNRKKIIPAIKSLPSRVRKLFTFKCSRKKISQSEIKTRFNMSEDKYRLYKAVVMTLFLITAIFYVATKAISDRYVYMTRGFIYDKWTNKAFMADPVEPKTN